MSTAGKIINQGTSHWCARLTEEDVLLLRELHAEGKKLREQANNLSIANLAEKFGISKTSAADAIHGYTWRHVRFPGEQ